MKNNKEYITINFIDVIKLLYDEDYTFKLEYECSKYSIKMKGNNDNKMEISNIGTKDGEKCVIYINRDNVFQSQDIESLKNQIMILAKLIGAH